MFCDKMSSVWLRTAIIKIYSQKDRKIHVEQNRESIENCLTRDPDPNGIGSLLGKGVH